MDGDENKSPTYLYWLAIKNVEAAISQQDSDRMFGWQKKVKKILGWRFRKMSQARMCADIHRIISRLDTYPDPE